MNLCTLDIETSDLAAVGSGMLLCAVVKPQASSSPIIFRYDKTGDRPGKEVVMVTRLIEQLARYDFIVGHNLEKFDVPYVRSRALVLGVAYNLRPVLIDTLKMFRRCGYLSRPNGFGKPSAGLSHVADLLGLFRSDKERKTAIFPREQWKVVWESDKVRTKAMDELVDHCVRDTLLTERVFEKLWEVDTKIVLRRTG